MELLKDRSYYRQRSDRALIEAAWNGPSAELAIVLAERLEASTTEHEAEIEEQKEYVADARREANRLDEDLYRAQNMITSLEWKIEILTKELEACRTKSK
jgi:predicted nuclease with TOPRIM domain